MSNRSLDALGKTVNQNETNSASAGCGCHSWPCRLRHLCWRCMPQVARMSGEAWPIPSVHPMACGWLAAPAIVGG